MKDYESAVIRAVKKACNGGKKPQRDTPLQQLNLDSLSFIGVIVELEKRYGIEFDDEGLIYDNYQIVTDIIDKVKELVNEK